MRKLLLCAALILAVGLLGWLPATQRDVGSLLPVQTLVATAENGRLALDGGEGLHGEGGSWESAMEDLRATAPGDAFFGTAGQVVLVGQARAVLTDVLDERELRPTVRIYASDGEVEAEGATAFFDAHKGGVTLQELQSAVLERRSVELPVLYCDEGRYRLADG